mmetsp:Transcript_42016/g.102551  ORF Transcript_42016/g.102551 Transcript_42016/m.102551 type:complete len:377 (-) Transcript_42016:58-1188(-)
MLQEHGRSPNLLLTIEVAVGLCNVSRWKPRNLVSTVPSQQLQRRLGVSLRLSFHTPRKHQQCRHIRMPVHGGAVKRMPVPPRVCVCVGLCVQERPDSLDVAIRRSDVQRRPLVLFDLQASQGPRSNQNLDHVVSPLSARQVHAACPVLSLRVDVGTRPDELLCDLTEAQRDGVVQWGPPPRVHVDELRPPSLGLEQSDNLGKVPLLDSSLKLSAVPRHDHLIVAKDVVRHRGLGTLLPGLGDRITEGLFDHKDFLVILILLGRRSYRLLNPLQNLVARILNVNDEVQVHLLPTPVCDSRKHSLHLQDAGIPRSLPFLFKPLRLLLGIDLFRPLLQGAPPHSSRPRLPLHGRHTPIASPSPHRTPSCGRALWRHPPH